MKKKDGLYYPRCLVNYLYWEINGKMLLCQNCPLCDTCREYRAAREFRGYD